MTLGHLVLMDLMETKEHRAPKDQGASLETLVAVEILDPRDKLVALVYVGQLDRLDRKGRLEVLETRGQRDTLEEREAKEV